MSGLTAKVKSAFSWLFAYPEEKHGVEGQHLLPPRTLDVPSPRRVADAPHPPLASLYTPRREAATSVSKITPVKAALGEDFVEADGFRRVADESVSPHGATPTDIVRGILRRAPLAGQVKRRLGESEEGSVYKRRAGEGNDFAVPVVSDDVRHVLETLNYLASPVVHALALRGRLRNRDGGRRRRRRNKERLPAREESSDEEDDEEIVREENDDLEEIPTASLASAVPVELSRSGKGRSVKRRVKGKSDMQSQLKKHAKDEGADADEENLEEGEELNGKQEVEHSIPVVVQNEPALQPPVLAAATASSVGSFNGFDGASSSFAGTFGGSAGFGGGVDLSAEEPNAQKFGGVDVTKKDDNPSAFFFGSGSSVPVQEPGSFSFGADKKSSPAAQKFGEPAASEGVGAFNDASSFRPTFGFGSGVDSLGDQSTSQVASNFGVDKDQEEADDVAKRRAQAEEDILEKARKAKKERLGQGFGMDLAQKDDLLGPGANVTGFGKKADATSDNEGDEEIEEDNPADGGFTGRLAGSTGGFGFGAETATGSAGQVGANSFFGFGDAESKVSKDPFGFGGSTGPGTSVSPFAGADASPSFGGFSFGEQKDSNGPLFGGVAAGSSKGSVNDTSESGFGSSHGDLGFGTSVSASGPTQESANKDGFGFGGTQASGVVFGAAPGGFSFSTMESATAAPLQPTTGPSGFDNGSAPFAPSTSSFDFGASAFGNAQPAPVFGGAQQLGSGGFGVSQAVPFFGGTSVGTTNQTPNFGAQEEASGAGAGNPFQAQPPGRKMLRGARRKR